MNTPLQQINLEDLSDSIRILDIGGGGEGLVSRIAGTRVCAVDYRMSEIQEAQIHNPPANWFVADGCSLPFKGESFDLCTLWFSLGYMSTLTIKRQVIQEAYRSLKQNGIIAILASRIDCDDERFIFHALFTLPDGTLSKVGYGVRGKQNQTASSICSLLKEIGFEDIQAEDYEWWFKIKAIKEQPSNSEQNLKVRTDARANNLMPGEKQ